MECQDVKKMLSEYVDGLLSDSLAPVVKQHLSTCNDCRDTYHALNRLIGLMRDMEPVDEPADFGAGVRAKLETGPSFSDRFRRLISPPLVKVPMGLAAALIVAVVIYILPRPEHPAEDQAALPRGTTGKKAQEQMAAGATEEQPASRQSAADKEQSPRAPGAVSGDVAGRAGEERTGEEVAAGEGEDGKREAEETRDKGTGTATAQPEEDVALTQTGSGDEDTAELDALMEVPTILEKAAPAPAAADSIRAAEDTIPVPVPPQPVDYRVAAVGGRVIATELDDAGDRVALIARVPADSVQALYRFFGQINVTRADIGGGGTESTDRRVQSATERSATRLSSPRRDSAATATPPSDSVVVRIRIKS